ncbi:GntR family transcriptional regulator [Paracoccus gahaiensis]|uniref:GntR family transcriptional regulator n=1 Tax=Paracoccus gahaiensis TaxID=1706839 RepID=A0A4V5MV02_9RHOB|nr:GntR family transcriptional regulator [Paracoccus gahaiensis]TJZ90278.1 GntR family transcriptional regulator [Paracoccus gahaiensis]
MDQTPTLSLAPLLAQWQITDGPGAKYQRLAGAFVACIQSGTYAPGSRLPSEVEICATLPLGLSTVQKALAQLVEDGLVVRRRKLGSFISDRDKQVPEVHVYRFRDPATGKVMMPFTRVLRTSRVATAEYGALLIEFEVEEVIRIDRLVWVPGAQPSYSTFFMRCEHHVEAPHAASETLNGASYHRLLWERFGLRIASVRHVASADLLSRQACEQLDLAAPHVGMIWDAYEFDREERLQIVQRFELPRGHRPMELTEGK